MKNSGALGGVDSKTVQFLTTSGSIYVPNEPSELTVTKLWYSEDEPLDPGNREIKVNLIQQAVQSNAVEAKVLSTSSQSWAQTHQAVANVAEGSTVTIRINVNWMAAASLYMKTAWRRQGCLMTGALSPIRRPFPRTRR